MNSDFKPNESRPAGKKGLSKEIAIAAGQSVKEREYWLNKLSGNLVKCNFPYDYDYPGKESAHPEKKTYGFKLPHDLGSRLNHLANNSDHNLYAAFLTGILALLNQQTNSSDIIITTSIYKQDIEGEFLNTVLLLRTRVHAAMTFKELLIQVRQNLIEANKNLNYLHLY